MLHEEVTGAPAGQAGKGMEGAQHSLCKGMRTPGKCRSLRGHKVSWKVRLRSDKKVLRWSVPKRLSLTYRFKNSLKCFHDGGVGRARRSGLHFRAMATVEKIPGRPTGSSTAPPGCSFCDGSPMYSSPVRTLELSPCLQAKA